VLLTSASQVNQTTFLNVSLLEYVQEDNSFTDRGLMIITPDIPGSSLQQETEVSSFSLVPPSNRQDDAQN
jgi:hypothetical protein